MTSKNDDVVDPAVTARTSPGDADQVWVDQWYGDDSPDPGIDPDTREGQAILRLFRTIKDVEETEGYWNGDDVVDQLGAWFRSVGIDPDEDPIHAHERLTLAVRARPGVSRRAADYTIRIGTEHQDAEQILTTALADLADRLGAGVGVRLYGAYGELARVERPADPLPSS